MKKDLFVSVLVLALVTLVFVLQLETRSSREIDQNLNKHAKVVENALWIIDPSVPRQYFPVVMKYENINVVTVEDAVGHVFFEFESPPEEGVKSLLVDSGLIRTHYVFRDIYRGETYLGNVSIVFRYNHLLTYAYFAIAAILIVALFIALRQSRRNGAIIARKSLELENSLQTLYATREELLESAKQAALGRLVAGVAHEINTPVGTTLTNITFLQERLQAYAAAFHSGTVPSDDSEEFLSVLNDGFESAVSCIRRASDLVSSFKQVSVDQSHETRRMFELNEYLGQLILALKPQWSRGGHELSLVSEGVFRMDSFPGSLSQVITNLVMNSLLHAFEDRPKGSMVIRTLESGPDAVRIEYSDNGSGMDETTRANMFDPFFTTKRNRGGTGLGMHIAYNLVTRSLAGTIECDSIPGEGTRFIIVVPLSPKSVDS